jgi:hypothetical protein
MIDNAERGLIKIQKKKKKEWKQHVKAIYFIANINFSIFILRLTVIKL